METVIVENVVYIARNSFEVKNILDEIMKSNNIDDSEKEEAGKKMFVWNLSIDELRDVFLFNPSLRSRVGERLMEMIDSPELVKKKIKQWLLRDPEKLAKALL